MSNGFHEGECAVQDRAGVRHMAIRVGNSIRAEFPERVPAFLRDRRMLFVAAMDGEGRPWLSVLSGPGGFLTVPDSRSLRIEASPHPDDPVTPGLAPGAFMGCIAIDFATRRRARINGRVRTADEKGITLEVDQVYSNCPKYIQRREPGREVEARPSPAPVRRGRDLTESQRESIRRADTFFIATVYPERGADASHRGGMPGFVHTVGSDIGWPDYPGNAMFNTLGNIRAYPRAGLLFLDFAEGSTLQLTGEAAIHWRPESAAAVPGAERLVRVTTVESVEIRDRLPFSMKRLDYSPFNPGG